MSFLGNVEYNKCNENSNASFFDDEEGWTLVDSSCRKNRKFKPKKFLDVEDASLIIKKIPQINTNSDVIGVFLCGDISQQEISENSPVSVALIFRNRADSELEVFDALKDNFKSLDISVFYEKEKVGDCTSPEDIDIETCVISESIPVIGTSDIFGLSYFKSKFGVTKSL